MSLDAPTTAVGNLVEEAANTRSASLPLRILRDATSSTGFRIGVAIFVILVLASLIYPEITSVDPTKMNIREKFMSPVFLGDKWSWAHLLGTDQLGRDVLLRSLIGLRYSLLIGILTVVLMFCVGCGLGIVSGFKGGLVDTVIMRITDAQLSIPMIILAISILGVSRPTIPAIILVLGLSGWPLYARVARSMTQGERGKEFVRGARIVGASDWRIIALLIMPNVLPPIAFVAVLDIARMMIFEAILGFLGLGIQPPTPSFGNIISDGRKYLINAWWIATSPGAFLALTLTSLNLMGAALERARNRVYSGEA
jgi:peptide/nickel transport system permease protein